MNLRFFHTVLCLGLFAVSCKKDRDLPPVNEPPRPSNEEEIITTFKLFLTDSASGATKTYLFADPDGGGGLPAYYGPTRDTQSDSVIRLKPNATYRAEIILLDETKSPRDTVSHEVREEGEAHMIFYSPTGSSVISQDPLTLLLDGTAITITYADLDAGDPPLPIGLLTTWRTGNTPPGAGHALEIELRHQLGTKSGNYAAGESDLSVKFRIVAE